tara:strand:+ start:64 stop:285 length:222 start_codon:yes stop_codon:yes gene_type:complete
MSAILVRELNSDAVLVTFSQVKQAESAHDIQRRPRSSGSMSESFKDTQLEKVKSNICQKSSYITFELLNLAAI